MQNETEKISQFINLISPLVCEIAKAILQASGWQVIQKGSGLDTVFSITKMGYNRLLEKVKPRVIETSSDGGELLEIDTNAAEGNFQGLDRIMRVIKVICPSTGQNYVLRVPPSITGYEQARQWTFGLREESIREGAFLELAKET